jgi:hypothetical protein
LVTLVVFVLIITPVFMLVPFTTLAFIPPAFQAQKSASD